MMVTVSVCERLGKEGCFLILRTTLPARQGRLYFHFVLQETKTKAVTRFRDSSPGVLIALIWPHGTSGSGAHISLLLVLTIRCLLSFCFHHIHTFADTTSCPFTFSHRARIGSKLSFSPLSPTSLWYKNTKKK